MVINWKYIAQSLNPFNFLGKTFGETLSPGEFVNRIKWLVQQNYPEYQVFIKDCKDAVNDKYFIWRKDSYYLGCANGTYDNEYKMICIRHKKSRYYSVIYNLPKNVNKSGKYRQNYYIWVDGLDSTNNEITLSVNCLKNTLQHKFRYA